MGFIQITTINADGVTTKDLSELSESERLDLELDVYFNAPVKLLCTVCRIEIPEGSGSFQCEKHRR